MGTLERLLSSESGHACSPVLTRTDFGPVGVSLLQARRCGQGPSGVKKDCLASFERVDHRQISLPQNAHEQRSRKSLSSLRMCRQSQPDSFRRHLQQCPADR